MAGVNGTGAGWRPEIADVLAGTENLGFYEVIAESINPEAIPAPLRTFPTVIPHGVGLSLGGAEGVHPTRVMHLAACADALHAPLVSEHVAFVRADGREAGHLLPLPRSREALDVLAVNIARTQSELDVPLALEPIAAVFDWPDDEFSEAEFMTRLLDRTGVLLLLDVANVYANARNRGLDARAVLDAMPLDRVAYCHVAGGAEHEGFYLDTHVDSLPPVVLELLAHIAQQSPGLPAMLERDGRFPPEAELQAELAAITSARGGMTTEISRPGTAARTTASG